MTNIDSLLKSRGIILPTKVHLVKVKESESEVAQSCPTLCYTIDCSLPGSSVHGIFQAIILEWIAISFSRGSSLPKDRNCISFMSCIGRQILYH